MKRPFSTTAGAAVMAFLIGTALVPAAADAQCPGGCRGGGQGMNCGMRGQGGGSPFGIWQNQQIVKDLNLSAEQVKQLKEADLALREKHLPMKAELDSLRLEMDQAFAAEPADEKAVLALTEKINAVKGRMAVDRTEARIALGKILTPEQTEKLNQRRGQGGGGMNRPCPMSGPDGARPCDRGGQGGQPLN